MVANRLPVKREDVDKARIVDEQGSIFGTSDDFLASGYDERGLVFQAETNLVRDYSLMLETDGKAQGVENLLIYPIMSAPMDIVPGEDDNGELEHIQSVLFDAPHEDGMQTHIETIIGQMCKGQTYKRTFFEKVLKQREDNKIGYDKIAWRPQETCELALDARTGEYRGFRQWRRNYDPDIKRQQRELDEYGFVNIRPQYAFVYTHGLWTDPIEGTSAMAVPYTCWELKRKIRFLWYQFIEQTALPKVQVTHLDGEEEAKLAAAKVATLKSRSVIGTDEKVKLNAFESSGKGAQAFIEAIQFLDSEMSASILGGFMDLTASAASGKGSFALSEDQSKLFLRTRRVVAKDMARQFNDQVIAPLVRWNFGKNASYPRLQFGPLSEANETAVLSLFTAMSTAASPPSVPDEFYDELVERTAMILELDPTKVRKAIDTEGSPLEKMRKAVEVSATAMTATAGAPVAAVPELKPEDISKMSPEEFLKAVEE